MSIIWYFRSAHAYLFVFDISSQESFNYISTIRYTSTAQEEIENKRRIIGVGELTILEIFG